VVPPMARGVAGRTVVAMTFLRPAPVLFVTMFASQASLLVLTAILPDLAAEFGVSTATAGQARTLAAVAGGVTALALGRLGRHLGVRELLLLGLSLLVIGSLASAAAPNPASARARCHRRSVLGASASYRSPKIAAPHRISSGMIGANSSVGVTAWPPEKRQRARSRAPPAWRGPGRRARSPRWSWGRSGP